MREAVPPRRALAVVSPLVAARQAVAGEQQHRAASLGGRAQQVLRSSFPACPLERRHEVCVEIRVEICGWT
jgi:hypothetical protein